MHAITSRQTWWYALWDEARVLVILTCSCGYEAYGDGYPDMAHRQALENFSNHIAIEEGGKDAGSKHFHPGCC